MPAARSERRLSRRVFLALGGAGALAGLTLVVRSRWVPLPELEDRIKHDPRLRTRLALDLDASSGVGELEDRELASLAALGEVLLPSRFVGNDEAKSTTLDVAGELAREVPGQRLELQRGVALLDRHSRAKHGSEFAALALDERRALVEEILAPMARSGVVGKGLRYVLSDGRDVWRLYRFVARALMVGFYSSELGWRLVGFERRPGDCAGLADYQGPPAPVSGG